MPAERAPSPSRYALPGALLLAAAYALASVFLGVTAAYVAMRTVNHLHASHKKSHASHKKSRASGKKGSES